MHEFTIAISEPLFHHDFPFIHDESWLFTIIHRYSPLVNKIQENITKIHH